MATVKSADGTQIYYEATESGPAVVLICAGPTDRNPTASWPISSPTRAR